VNKHGSRFVRKELSSTRVRAAKRMSAQVGVLQRDPELLRRRREQTQAFLDDRIEQRKSHDVGIGQRRVATAERFDQFAGPPRVLVQQQGPDQGILTGLVGGAEQRGDLRGHELIGRTMSALVRAVGYDGQKVVVIDRAPLAGDPFDDAALQLLGALQHVVIRRSWRIDRTAEDLPRPVEVRSPVDHVRDRVALVAVVAEEEGDRECAQHLLDQRPQIDRPADRPGRHLLLGEPQQPVAPPVDVPLLQGRCEQPPIVRVLRAHHADDAMAEPTRRRAFRTAGTDVDGPPDHGVAQHFPVEPASDRENQRPRRLARGLRVGQPDERAAFGIKSAGRLQRVAQEPQVPARGRRPWDDARRLRRMLGRGHLNAPPGQGG
jgi:hypothetical protein